MSPVPDVLKTSPQVKPEVKGPDVKILEEKLPDKADVPTDKKEKAGPTVKTSPEVKKPLETRATQKTAKDPDKTKRKALVENAPGGTKATGTISVTSVKKSGRKKG